MPSTAALAVKKFKQHRKALLATERHGDNRRQLPTVQLYKDQLDELVATNQAKGEKNWLRAGFHLPVTLYEFPDKSIMAVCKSGTFAETVVGKFQRYWMQRVLVPTQGRQR